MTCDADLAEIRPSAVRKLDGSALVRTTQAMAVSAVGAKREPKRVITSAVIDIGRDLRTTNLAISKDAVETVGEEIGAVGAKGDDRRELSAVSQSLNVVEHDLVVDGRTNLSAGISDETVQRENFTHGNTRRRIGWQPRR